MPIFQKSKSDTPFQIGINSQINKLPSFGISRNLKNTNMKNILIAFSISALALTAADKSKTWTDPELALKEDTDFSIQGEYHREGAALGAQIVALGDGKFDLYLLLFLV